MDMIRSTGIWLVPRALLLWALALPMIFMLGIAPMLTDHRAYENDEILPARSPTSFGAFPAVPRKRATAGARWARATSGERLICV